MPVKAAKKPAKELVKKPASTDEKATGSGTTIISNRRVLCKYSASEKALIDATADCINSGIKKLHLLGCQIHDNQKTAASMLVDNFADGKVLIQLALGKTQSGKTGLMLSTVQQFIKKYPIPSANIYVITGLSSKNWVAQTTERMPAELTNNIYHRDSLKKFATDVLGKKNVLIIIDEVHMACLADQTIHLTFEAAGLLDLQYMFDHDIKIIDISATPNGVWWNVAKWASYSKMVFMEPGKNYVSSGDLLKSGKLIEYKSLSSKTPGEKKENTANVTELKNTIDSFKLPSYHIIRTDTGAAQKKVLKSLKTVMQDTKYDYLMFDQSSAITDINEILSVEPAKHTIILLKEMLRCAKSINKKYIGVLYERYAKKVDNSVIIQGLLGRLTGYDYNGKSICFTHLESVELYETCWNTKFADVSKWSSGSTVKKKGVVVAKNTFTAPDLVVGLGSKEENTTTTIKVFDNYDECKDFIAERKWKKPVKKRAGTGGFCTYKISGVNKIYTIAEAKTVVKSDIMSTDVNRYRYCVGYSNTKDPDTIKHIVAYKL